MNNKIASVLLKEYRVFNSALNPIGEADKTLINTINQYSFCIAEQDVAFKEALLGSEVLLPDGMAIVAAVRLLTGQKIKKIAGADMHLHLLQELEQKGGSCFYLGSSTTTLQLIKERLAKEFPAIKVGSYSPPYRPEFSPEDNTQMIAAVNSFQPDVLFIGMTAPKQEKWAFAHKEQLNTTIICSIGAVFDFYAGTVTRPSPFWIRLRLEWFIRLLKEPRRMWKRYLYYGPVFVGLVLREKIRRL